MGKWEMVRLGDVFDLQMGKTPSRDNATYWNDGIYKWISIADIGQANKYITDTKETITQDAIQETGIKLVPKNTVIMSFKLSLGKTAITAQDMYTNEAIMAFHNKGMYSVYIDYLYHLFRWFPWGLNTNKAVMGATLNKVTLSNIKIPLPPLDEQKRIAKNLDLASEIVKGYKEQLAELDKLVQSVFYEMFGDPVTNEKGWEVTNLGRCIELLTDFSANGAYEYLDSNVKMYDEPNYALMIRTTDLEKNDFTNGVKYIDESAYKILEKSKVFGDEIIMSKIGSAGKIYLMPKLNMPVSLGRNAFLIRLIQNINVIFVFNLLSTNYGKAEIMQYVRGAVTKTITKDSVRAIRLVIPPLELQTSFASIVTEIEDQKVQIRQALTEAENLFNSLMQEYFE